jgi:hypothetical protein
MPRITRVVGVLVGTVLSLMGGLASAAPPVKEASPSVEGELLVWSGGKTRAEAESQKEGLEAYQEALDSVLKVKPEVLESAKVEGLKPGFFIVALGVCPKDKVQEPLGVFQTLYPDVYTRTVKYRSSAELPALECPELVTVTTNSADEPVLWGLEKADRVAQGGRTLVGLSFEYSWAEAGDFARSYSEVKAIYLLVESKTRKLLDSKVYDGPSDATTLESFTLEDGRLVSSLKYGDPPCSPSTDYFKGWRNKITVSIAKDGIKFVEGKPKKIDEGSCGYAEESRMISGEGHGD